MKQVNITYKGREYILNNNNSKFDRTVAEVGDYASHLEFLAAYDRLGGLITDESGNKVENGIFAKSYEKWKKEQPIYIKILEEREKTLDEGERRNIDLSILNIGHKRSFLGTLMTIAAAIVAGLFFFFTSDYSSDNYLTFLAILSGFGMAFFILGSAAYLAFILSQESVEANQRIQFVRNSKKDFIEKVGVEITDIDSYEAYRQRKYEEERELDKKIPGTHEVWFILVVSLFVLSAISLVIMFLPLS